MGGGGMTVNMKPGHFVSKITNGYLATTLKQARNKKGTMILYQRYIHM
jgi:hypothetical protein